MIKIELGNVSIGKEDYTPTITLPNLDTEIAEEPVEEPTKEPTGEPNKEPEIIKETDEPQIFEEEQDNESIDLLEDADEKITMVDVQPACTSCPVDRDAVLFSHCEEIKTYTMQDTYLDGQGRILDISLKINKVCPHKRVALGIAVVELDERGREYPRGLKTITIPAHHAPVCRDVPINSIRFILPEDISVGGSSDLCQSARRFRVRATAHYIDVASTMSD